MWRCGWPRRTARSRRLLALAFTVGVRRCSTCSRRSIARRFDASVRRRAGSAPLRGPAAAVRLPGARGASSRLSRRRSPLLRPARSFSSLLCAWRARIARTREASIFVAAFFAVAAQAVWSATHLTIERLRTAVGDLRGVRLVTAACRSSRGGSAAARAGGRRRRRAARRASACCCSSRPGPIAPAALWALALLLAILNAALFIESAPARLPLLSQVGSVLSWLVLAMWWLAPAGSRRRPAVARGAHRADADHAWRPRLGGPVDAAPPRPARGRSSVRSTGLYLGLDRPPVPVLRRGRTASGRCRRGRCSATLVVITLARERGVARRVRAPMLHVARRGAAAIVVAAWTHAAARDAVDADRLVASAVLSALRACSGSSAGAGSRAARAPAAAALALFIGELTAMLAAVGSRRPPPFSRSLVARMSPNIAAILLALTSAATAGALVAGRCAGDRLGRAAAVAGRPRPVTSGRSCSCWPAALLRRVRRLSARPRRRARAATAIRSWSPLVASAMIFFAARAAFDAGGLEWMIGVVPVAAGAGHRRVLLRQLLSDRARRRARPGRLALVAGAALAFVTVAIPLQLEHQWITIGWALEGAALAWLYRASRTAGCCSRRSRCSPSSSSGWR